MCGIFGSVVAQGCIDIGIAERASRLLRHRGPDDEGYLLADSRSGEIRCYGGPDTPVSLRLPPVGAAAEHANAYDTLLMHRRLSILDLSVAGHEPMPTADGKRWITYNGEIYNFLELKTELQSLGHSFRTATDTEVILAAYERWGAGALQRLVGMFALVILDLESRTLFLARDAFGIKPLYYTVTPIGLSFASEIAPLLELHRVGRRANPSRVYDYLRFGFTDHGDETLFKDVRQLPAAHFLTVDLTHLERIPPPQQYWSLVGKSPARLSFEDAALHLRELFLESIRLHLRSDVPVGACLSGGIDSSAIIAAMREVGGPGLDLNTFTYVAADPAVDEERWADTAGTAARGVMHKVHASPVELLHDLDELIRVQGEPFGSTSIYAQHRVFRQAQAGGMKVMLDGQGADELFLGYPIFLSLRVASLLNQGRVGEALRFARIASRTGTRFGSILLYAGGRLTPRPIQPALMSLIGQPAEPAWMARGWFRRNGVPQKSHGWFRGGQMLRRESTRSVAETSLPALLRYEDRNSMNWSIESRVPFLTPAIASFAASLPTDYLLSPNGVTKSVLRCALRGLVPDPILDRRGKVGFETPQQSWLREIRPRLERVLNSELLEGVPALDPAAVRAALNGQFAHGANRTRTLWTWYNLVLWAEQFRVDFSA
jgi:asparagine synthase (glutamine-hydrolysing)